MRIISKKHKNKRALQHELHCRKDLDQLKSHDCAKLRDWFNVGTRFALATVMPTIGNFPFFGNFSAQKGKRYFLYENANMRKFCE